MAWKEGGGAAMGRRGGPMTSAAGEIASETAHVAAVRANAAPGAVDSGRSRTVAVQALGTTTVQTKMTSAAWWVPWRCHNPPSPRDGSCRRRHRTPELVPSASNVSHPSVSGSIRYAAGGVAPATQLRAPTAAWRLAAGQCNSRVDGRGGGKAPPRSRRRAAPPSSSPPSPADVQEGSRCFAGSMAHRRRRSPRQGSPHPHPPLLKPRPPPLPLPPCWPCQPLQVVPRAVLAVALRRRGCAARRPPRRRDLPRAPAAVAS